VQHPRMAIFLSHSTVSSPEFDPAQFKTVMNISQCEPMPLKPRKESNPPWAHDVCPNIGLSRVCDVTRTIYAYQHSAHRHISAKLGIACETTKTTTTPKNVALPGNPDRQWTKYNKLNHVISRLLRGSNSRSAPVVCAGFGRDRDRRVRDLRSVQDLLLTVGLVVQDDVAAATPQVRADGCQCHGWRYELVGESR